MDQIFKRKLKSHEVMIVLGAFLGFFTILCGFILYHPFLKTGVKSQKALKPGNEMRDFYLKLPIPLDFRIYFFNITNPDEVQEGGKPSLQEVGPYCYDAYKEKINIEEDKHEDTLTYSPYDTYFFNQTRTGELSHDDYVTILNPLIVGMINTVADQKPQYLKTLNKALPVIFKESNSIYLTTRVRDILFDGVEIDCRVKDFSATAVCSQFRGQQAMVEVEKNLYKFSLFGARNGTIPTRVTVKRGIKNGRDLGKVTLVDNKTDLQVWPEKECNEFRGTDGWIFPSFLKPEEGIWSVSIDLCRSIQAKYIKSMHFKGISVRKYFATLGDMSSNPEEKCFCPKPDSCLPKGVMDLTKCLKVPIYCTLPHFLETDEKLLQDVDGLKPDVEKHIIKIYFEPITGTPVLGQRRIQFNLKLTKIEKISIMKTVPEVIHPILWLEEGVVLEGFLLKKISTATTMLNIVTGFRYISLLGSMGMIGYGCYVIYTEKQKSKVAPVDKSSPKSVTSQDNKQEGSALHSLRSGVEQNGFNVNQSKTEP